MTQLSLYFNFVSTTIFISIIFTIVLGLFLFRIPKKSKSTFHLSLAFLFFCGLNLSYFIGFSIYSPWAAYHDWFVLIFAFLSVAHIIQFLLYFSGMTNSKIPRRLLGFYYMISFTTSIAWSLETFNRHIVFRAEGQFWNFSTGAFEGFVSLVVLLVIISILPLGIWRVGLADQKVKKSLSYFVLGFVLLTFAPAIANALYMNQLITKDSFQLIYSVINIHGWFVVFILYLNTTKERVSFLAKILSVSFTTYMILLIIFSYALLELSDQAYYVSKLSNAKLAVHSDDARTADLAYIHSSHKKTGITKLLYSKKEADPDFSTSKTTNQHITFKNADPTNTDYFIRQNETRTYNYYALFYHDKTKDVTYEVGFDYLAYRRYIHDTCLYILYLLVLVLIVLIIGQPLFMKGSLTRPINSIIAGLKEATIGNYKKIPANDAEDEIGYMARSFNEMVSTIAASKKQITEYTQNLENMVQERTESLRKAQQELITAARRSGMADIASNVLHNVGNVLNSVNINADTLRDIAGNINVEGMNKANKLFAENRHDPEFFKNPESKGQKMVEFYALLCNSVIDAKEEMQLTLDRLEDQIKVIKEIISAQQQYASGPAFQERIDLTTAIEQMLLIQKDSISKHKIKIINEINEVPEISGHSIKLLHILINLYLNAKDAVLKNDPDQRLITLQTRHQNNKVILSFADNGTGFDNSLKTKIFQHGYSTKEEGRGFGLHSCANDIREMNGSIAAESKGINQGATFTLTFNLENS
ncbi:MAG: ATP-binding protein [Proteobacteria bacterium]|nr:ATP-binding protein [Pseudomonadota bacterium]